MQQIDYNKKSDNLCFSRYQNRDRKGSLSKYIYIITHLESDPKSDPLGSVRDRRIGHWARWPVVRSWDRSGIAFGIGNKVQYISYTYTGAIPAIPEIVLKESQNRLFAVRYQPGRPK